MLDSLKSANKPFKEFIVHPSISTLPFKLTLDKLSSFIMCSGSSVDIIKSLMDAEIKDTISEDEVLFSEIIPLN